MVFLLLSIIGCEKEDESREIYLIMMEGVLRTNEIYNKETYSIMSGKQGTQRKVMDLKDEMYRYKIPEKWVNYEGRIDMVRMIDTLLTFDINSIIKLDSIFYKIPYHKKRDSIYYANINDMFWVRFVKYNEALRFVEIEKERMGAK